MTLYVEMGQTPGLWAMSGTLDAWTIFEDPQENPYRFFFYLFNLLSVPFIPLRQCAMKDQQVCGEKVLNNLFPAK